MGVLLDLHGQWGEIRDLDLLQHDLAGRIHHSPTWSLCLQRDHSPQVLWAGYQDQKREREAKDRKSDERALLRDHL